MKDINPCIISSKLHRKQRKRCVTSVTSYRYLLISLYSKALTCNNGNR